jgi:hypothetical protein
MPRKSNVTVRPYEMADGTVLAGVVFPTGRVVVYREDLLMFYHDETRVPLKQGSLLRKQARPRTGVGYRTRDVTGVSGEGVVFDFAHFPTGWVVQEWRNQQRSGDGTRHARDSGMDFRPSMRLAVKIHGHNGATEYVYDNGEVAQR